MFCGLEKGWYVRHLKPTNTNKSDGAADGHMWHRFCFVICTHLLCIAIISSEGSSHQHIGTELDSLGLFKSSRGDRCQQHWEIQRQHCPLVTAAAMSNLDIALSALQQQADSLSARLVGADLRCNAIETKAAMICDDSLAVTAKGCQRLSDSNRGLKLLSQSIQRGPHPPQAAT